jgi:molybdenum cofactor cytidylyltransferase
VTPQVIARFADLAAEHGSDTRVRGVFEGAPGHPVALGSAYFDDLMALAGDVGARDVLKRIGAFPIELGHLCSGIDVDTPEALEDLRS